MYYPSAPCGARTRRPFFCNSAFVAAADILEDCKLSIENCVSVFVDKNVEFLRIFASTCPWVVAACLDKTCSLPQVAPGGESLSRLDVA